MYKYFKRESVKTKNRVPPKLKPKTAEATGYGKRTVRIVAEKSSLSEAVKENGIFSGERHSRPSHSVLFFVQLIH